MAAISTFDWTADARALWADWRGRKSLMEEAMRIGRALIIPAVLALRLAGSALVGYALPAVAANVPLVHTHAHALNPGGTNTCYHSSRRPSRDQPGAVWGKSVPGRSLRITWSGHRSRGGCTGPA
jgi:hypothetical protein